MIDLETQTPDFVGTFDKGKGFKMYLTKKGPILLPCTVAPGFGLVDGFAKGIEKIEGVIIDEYGISVFTGQLSEREIKFKKTYSLEAVDKQGAYEHIQYSGLSDENSHYLGHYTVENRPSITGLFELQAVETEQQTLKKHSSR